MAKIILEGLDRLGKSTLIQGVMNRLGYHEVLHFQKPKLLDVYGHSPKMYQEESFKNLFRILSCSADVICDRAHLGEYVYSPLYRGYDGSYVFDLEDSFIASGSKFHEQTLLVLLTCSDPSKFGDDDGEGFDWSKRTEEQEQFKIAFDRSRIIRKKMISVDRDGVFKKPEEIVEELLA